MITVYVLESLKDGVHYTGMAKNALLRLNEHNAGKKQIYKKTFTMENNLY